MTLFFAESRAKFETEQKLKVNQAEQRALNEAALQQELDLRQKKISQKITEVNSRKHVQLMTSQVAKKEHQVKHETFYSHKFSKRLFCFNFVSICRFSRKILRWASFDWKS